MKNLIHTAVITLFAASAAHAQQAVQWKVSDGGNGHWYAFNASITSWHDARSIALGRGGDLASLSSTPEREFWMSRIPIGAGAPECAGCTWLGGFQDRSAPEYSEPGGGWRWSDGTAWNYTFWNPGEPNDLTGQDYLYGSGPTNGRWDDSSGSCCAASVIEWSADCNGDGIVDYGQCHGGTLPDYNGNNIPDCCERGEACVVGNYPVQWRIEDGGNGHWYQLRTQGLTIAWQSADAVAKADGGYLASILSEDEDIFVFRLSDTPGAWQGPLGPWLGGAQIPGSGEPVGTWIWLSSGDPWTYAGPNSDFADNGSGVDENRLHYVDHARRWNDIAEDGFPEYFGGIRSLLIEWSADCNNDGVVDYGQILQGQLADNDVDGIPDVCEQPTCVDADLFRDFNVNGADLGILLSQWGPNTALTVSDINKDGFVNGADLGIMLSFWGACP